jgi:hypothetical protein
MPPADYDGPYKDTSPVPPYLTAALDRGEVAVIGLALSQSISTVAIEERNALCFAECMSVLPYRHLRPVGRSDRTNDDNGHRNYTL